MEWCFRLLLEGRGGRGEEGGERRLAGVLGGEGRMWEVKGGVDVVFCSKLFDKSWVIVSIHYNN